MSGRTFTIIDEVDTFGPDEIAATIERMRPALPVRRAELALASTSRRALGVIHSPPEFPRCVVATYRLPNGKALDLVSFVSPVR